LPVRLSGGYGKKKARPGEGQAVMGRGDLPRIFSVSNEEGEYNE